MGSLKRKNNLILLSFLLIVGLAYIAGESNGKAGRSLFALPQAEANAGAGPGIGPNKAIPDRKVYYPGTEVLAEDEVRVVACGTGMPDQRLSQASSCWLFEFGNGEKLIFDLGTGSMRNLASLLIPYEYMAKVILSHLHTDPLESVPQFSGQYVFSGSYGQRPVSGYSHAKQRAEKLCDVKDWRLHDLRRTVATQMAGMGISLEIIERVLNHAPRGVTAQVYNRYTYLPEKKRAFETWGRKLESLIRPAGDNVVELPARAEG